MVGVPSSWFGVVGESNWWRVGLVTACALIGLGWPGADSQPVRHAVEITDGPLSAQLVDGHRDVWDSKKPGSITVVLSDSELRRLRADDIEVRVVASDIDAIAAAERARLQTRDRSVTSPDWFAEYRDVDEIGAYLDLLGERHPRLVTQEDVGSSLEGRPIRTLTISNGGRTKVVLNGGHHAREWISVMVPMCIADRLARGYEDDARIRALLDHVTFIVAPLVNPDGYVYSWTTDRYWRKNRRGGYGVDLNRNYSVAWGGRGSSKNRRSQTYRGESAFSEPETRAMRALFEAHDVAAHLDFHSYSQLIIYPWAHKREHPEARDKFAAAADRMSTAMQATNGERYRILPGAELGGGAAGTFGDWAYGERGALSLLVELRPSGRRGGGFVLPPEQIVPTCEENLAAVLELAEFIVEHP